VQCPPITHNEEPEPQPLPRLIPFQFDYCEFAAAFNREQAQNPYTGEITLAINNEQVFTEKVRSLGDPVLKFSFQMAVSQWTSFVSPHMLSVSARDAAGTRPVESNSPVAFNAPDGWTGELNRFVDRHNNPR
jgi:hypothetical protein